jgi:hypothetical protein
VNLVWGLVEGPAAHRYIQRHTGIIELSSLTNAESTTTNDEDFLHID